MVFAYPVRPGVRSDPRSVDAGTCAWSWGKRSFTHDFPGSAFTLQRDGTLRCPVDHLLYPKARRPERDGSLRVLYAARIGHCRNCPLRAQCQESAESRKPRRVSAVLWPLNASRMDSSHPPETARAPLASAPVLWHDWPRCRIRRVWPESWFAAKPSAWKAPLHSHQHPQKRLRRNG